MLASCKCDFKHPLFYPGEITLLSSVSFIKNTSFGISHQIMNGDNVLAALAEDVMVLFDFNQHIKVAFPEEFRRKIEDLEHKKFV